MGDEKSNLDNGKKENKKSIQHDESNQDKTVTDNVNEQDKSFNRCGTSGTNGTSNNIDIKSLADEAVDINVLRFELDRLQLDFKARAYFENDVKPLIDTLYTLGLASLDFSATAASLSNTNFGRSSKIKDALKLTEGVDEISSDVIKVLRCKVDNMLKLSKYDCK